VTLRFCADTYAAKLLLNALALNVLTLDIPFIYCCKECLGDI
jgi:hypothetical protein